ncbi:hypothetical protein [Pseudonocardia sp. KRD291]|uniref:hypothetical protein n=1 Tax=Pseudonocardia sp. KRD291 TaxID=2792007 RepID=UPI001C49CEA1|nr:hypothetical protein [Pseudonocardia sp. KRD291]MBW0105447.1 hypothetical protein [Pseudonocardia sp. KRD291]
MSTNRRRPTGGPRRPQVAGRPRTAGPSDTESQESAEGTLAVEERTGVAPPARQEPGPRAERSDADTTTRDPMRPVGGSAAAPGVAEGTGAGSERSGDDRPELDRTEYDRPEQPESAGDAGDAAAGSSGGRRRIPMPSAPTTRRGTALLLAVTVLLSAAAVFFAVSFFGMRFTGAATNTALSDVGTTAAVSEQIGEAVTKVYSFDFARLDQAEADARAGITAPFDQQFDQIFGNVRQLAPQQQAVVTATVPKSAVASIDGDRATVYLFVNQVITRVDDRGARQQGGAAARLRVDAQNVDGRWKIAGMSPA